MEEVWRPIEGYPNYRVSNLGNVWSNVSNRLLKISPGNRGYVITSITNKDGQKSFPVHRLVAKAFLRKSKVKLYVNHIDGDRANNVVSNLEWCTSSENKRNAQLRGTVPSKPPVRKCVSCGKFFQPSQRGKMACSRECGNKTISRKAKARYQRSNEPTSIKYDDKGRITNIKCCPFCGELREVANVSYYCEEAQQSFSKGDLVSPKEFADLRSRA